MPVMFGRHHIDSVGCCGWGGLCTFEAAGRRWTGTRSVQAACAWLRMLMPWKGRGARGGPSCCPRSDGGAGVAGGGWIPNEKYLHVLCALCKHWAGGRAPSSLKVRMTSLTEQHSCRPQFLPVPTGDEILELNGESMAGLTHQDALQKFKVIICYQDAAQPRPSPSLLGHLWGTQGRRCGPSMSRRPGSENNRVVRTAPATEDIQIGLKTLSVFMSIQLQICFRSLRLSLQGVFQSPFYFNSSRLKPLFVPHMRPTCNMCSLAYTRSQTRLFGGPFCTPCPRQP